MELKNTIGEDSFQTRLIFESFNPNNDDEIATDEFINSIESWAISNNQITNGLILIEDCLSPSETETSVANINCISPQNISGSFGNNKDKASENNPNDEPTSMEEHFEFNPNVIENNNINSKNNLNNEDNNHDFVYEDFSNFSNGDSFSSIKSGQFQQRSSWLRSSIKRNGRRSSLSYESDEMNNDANLEEDVLNLNDKLKKLQEQIEILTEAQMKNEIKYTSMKRENINLNDKINFLEEHVRDIEIQSDERKQEDERRFRESMARLEREKSQEVQNYVNRILDLQNELFASKEEVKEFQQKSEYLREQKEILETQLRDRELELELLKKELVKRDEQIKQQSELIQENASLIEELNGEMITRKNLSDSTQQMEHLKARENEMNDINVELENQLRTLKQENRTLKDSNEELTAQLLNNHLMEGKSLLKEGEAISSLANEISDLNTEQLKTALKEQQDVNTKLRSYIDGILLNIVENYPQLLEKQSAASSDR
ncbi:hypothetical protein RDWZM_005202 [Blomia tropicalis]|uniref:FIP-RBD domain-containing protein n=1 Tax=Blomia tropicalis TaxID=40697 RepID=A0A9Q0M586_BLOTA|nr:hypothetical protein RDWZM_005202 [Blomia tropicalis]